MLSAILIVLSFQIISDGVFGVIFPADSQMKHNFWKNRPYVPVNGGNPQIPIQLPGVLDSWAGGDKKEIRITAPYDKTTIMTLAILDSHDIVPPKLEVIVGGRKLSEIQVKRGSGSSNWDALGEYAYNETVTIPKEYLAGPEGRDIVIRSASGSWVAFDKANFKKHISSWQYIVVGAGWLILLVLASLALRRSMATMPSEQTTGTLINSPVWALFALASITMAYGSGQEILTIGSPHDDYYFILRSATFNFAQYGEYHSAIKEYLYSLFVGLSRVYALSLRSFEALSYAVALFWLWDQTAKLTKSYLIAWLTVVPLAVFTYQHPVFNRATYDALQLILIPATFASAFQIFSKRGNITSLVVAGLIAGLQILTRPEGALFILPPMVSLLFVSGMAFVQTRPLLGIRRFLWGMALVCAIPFLLQQGMSAVNKLAFGFWAPTIIKSPEFEGAFSALMSIKPAGSSTHRYAPFPKSSMEFAYKESPEFRKAKPFFDQNIDGNGWSQWASAGYRAEDGSVAGGWLQWAILDASAVVAGPHPKAMLAYLSAVTREIQSAFDRGKLEKRRVILTAVGPEFSIFEPYFWASATRIGAILLNYADPLLPVISSVSPYRDVELNFNRLALRRTALMETQRWGVSGWIVNPSLGAPHHIALDQEAQDAGIRLSVLNRPDIAKSILGLDTKPTSMYMCGFELNSPGSSAGALTVRYDGQATDIPLNKLKTIKPGEEYHQDGIRVGVDFAETPTPSFEHTQIAIVKQVSIAAHYIMKALFAVSPFLLAAVFFFGEKLVPDKSHRVAMVLAATLALSVILPRWTLLSAIDSQMYPGDEPRYLSTASFSIWFLASFTTACFIYGIYHKALVTFSINAKGK